MKGKMIGGRTEGSKPTISKERALVAFKKVRDMYAVLAMRKGRREFVAKERARGNELADALFKDADNPYPNISDRNLRSRLSRERKTYKSFWEARLSGITLFDENCGWAPNCEGLVVVTEGRKPIVLLERTASMLMLLSEPACTYYEGIELAHAIRANFESEALDFVKISTVLHPSVLEYLMHTLDVQHIVNFLLIVSNKGLGVREFDSSDVHRTIRALGEREIELLADYCVTSDSGIYNLIEIIRKDGGEEGKAIIEQIIKHAERISRYFERKLDFAKNQQSETGN